VLGEGGFVPAPREYVRALSEFARAHGILVIADEIQTGFGRTGRMFACEHYDLVPDLITTAKSLAGGLPLAGRDGTLAHRFGGTPASGRVRAKTGSLQRVVGLTGWASARRGPSLEFSLLANQLPSEAAGSALQDAVATALVSYPDAPSPDELALPAP
jgi:hypothetical protein